MFSHLRTHSQYSILDGTASVEALVERAVAQGMKALALTDHGNLYGAVELYKACKDAKIKALIGCELFVAPFIRTEKKKVPGFKVAYSLPLLAKDKEGYRNLCKLSSLGFIEGFYYVPRIDEEILNKHKSGLLCLDGSMGTRLAQEILQGSPESIRAFIEKRKELFGSDYYFDLQNHAMSPQAIQEDGYRQETWLLQQHQDYVSKQAKLNQALIELAPQFGIPLVATNDVHYLDRSDWYAHEILLNIQSGETTEIWEKDSRGDPKFRVPNPKRQTYSSHEFDFKTTEQMQELFKETPEAIANTQLIVDKCQVEIDLKTKHYPVYLPPSLTGKSYSKEEQSREVEKYLWKLCEEGIPKRYTPDRLAKIKELFPDQDPMQIVRDRLNYEMSIIVPKEMSDYLLIVWDFINWAKNNGIPMGPGRGSGAGSIVLYLIGVTDIEPLRFYLFFERFINPERISYPDIDVDICMEGRNRVIAYTLEKYGKGNVAQIITFGTMKAKMVLKDVGRVLDIPLAQVNTIAKLIPDDLNITLDKALEKEADLRNLYENDEVVRRLIDQGLKLEGSIRSTGTHAAGIIISGVSLTDLIPLCTAKDSEMAVTQFSMKPVEAVGMLKVDFLGLKTLTAIQICVDAIKIRTGQTIDWVNLPLDDKPTFDLLNQGKTLGIFQLESGGMQDLARQLHLDCFEEIIAVGALYRPGPMDMIPSFINRKHGREPIDYDHPWMKEILAETYGIMVYQEQVMQIASKLANYSLGEGDVLRRAMGKKDAEQMAQQREKFRLGALQNNISEQLSMHIFDKMEKFASYGFNKSHAAAYGYLSYVTAYMKANYPKEWMAALMTCDCDDTAKVSKFIHECQAMSISILPPDINEAGKTFQATDKGVRFAITAIKGIGEGVVDAIIEERKRKGPFLSFYQFFKRCSAKKIGKKAIESMVWAGCFDYTGWSRAALIQSIDPIFEAVSREQKEQSEGVLSFFSLVGDTSEKEFLNPPIVKLKISKSEILQKEKALLGFFLTGHPMDEFKHLFERLSCVPLKQIETLSDGAVIRAAFIVEDVQIKTSNKTQRKFAILSISDGLERLELPIWSDIYEEKHLIINENRLLYAIIQIEKKEGETRLSCKWLDDLTQTDEAMIQACDKVYDKSKTQSERTAYAKKSSKVDSNKKKEMTTPMEKPKKNPSQIKIVLDANKTKLSHILQLKTIFEEHRGTTPVLIHFHADQTPLAKLHIDSKWGILDSDKVQDAIRKIHAVREVAPG